MIATCPHPADLACRVCLLPAAPDKINGQLQGDAAGSCNGHVALTMACRHWRKQQQRKNTVHVFEIQGCLSTCSPNILKGPCVTVMARARACSVTGCSSECLCSDITEIHIPEPSGSGSSRRAPEHFPDQPDAQWPQPGGLCQCAGKQLHEALFGPSHLG